MKTCALFVSLSLSLVVSGCIDTKDVGLESDASTGGTTSGTSMSGEGSGSESDPSASSATLTASGTGTTTADSQTGSESGGDTEGGETTSISGTATSSGGGESSTGSDTDSSVDAQIFCEDSGGIWDEKSCGHYTCGLAPDCDAIVPGCDCGVGSTFIPGPGSGCSPSEDCEPVAFPCGPDLTCSAPGEFCDVFIPGVKGADTTYSCVEAPDSCDDAYTCACMSEGGDCEMGPDGGITLVTAGA